MQIRQVCRVLEAAGFPNQLLLWCSDGRHSGRKLILIQGLPHAIRAQRRARSSPPGAVRLPIAGYALNVDSPHPLNSWRTKVGTFPTPPPRFRVCLVELTFSRWPRLAIHSGGVEAKLFDSVWSGAVLQRLANLCDGLSGSFHPEPET